MLKADLNAGFRTRLLINQMKVLPADLFAGFRMEAPLVFLFEDDDICSPTSRR
jgi:hypothetical protein